MFKSSFIVMIINMMSRLLGLIREMIIANMFGATGLTDAYVSATKIPNFFTTLFGEGSMERFSFQYIIVDLKKREKRG